MHRSLPILALLSACSRAPEPTQVEPEPATVAPTPTVGARKPRREVVPEGPSRTLRYRVTLAGVSFWPGEPGMSRVTWSLEVGSSWARVSLERETGPSTFIGGGLEKVAWERVDRTEFVGSCDALYGGPCFDGASIAPELALDLASDAGAEGLRSLQWRCSPATVPALPARAKLIEGDCELESSRWIPASRRPLAVVRCDGISVPEPSRASQIDPDGARSRPRPMGLHFAPEGGVEWVYEQYDCPPPGEFRKL